MRYAVITGATQGIGKAIAEKLLSEGFSIAICARSKEDLEMVGKIWEEQFPLSSIITHPADLSIRDEAFAFADKVATSFPVLDILVNNAGIFMPGNLAEEQEGHLEQMMAVNLYSAYHITRRLLPQIEKTTDSHIFNMCSVASLKAYPGGGSYGISKYALLGFSENLREELKPKKVRVTAICPGATYSRSWEGSGVSAERMMECEDVAKMVWSAYTLSPRADVETIIMRPINGDL